MTVKNSKTAFTLSAVLVSIAGILGCVSSGGRGPGAATPPVSDGTLWYYRAFGQSVDLVFRNTSHAKSQDGINNVWINPDWLGAAAADNFIQSDEQKAAALQADVPVNLKDLGEGYQILLDSRGGKLANGHDGLTYFFTVLPTSGLYTLSADVTKIQHGPNAADTGVTGKNGQGGGGLMARDVLGVQRKEPSVTGYEELPAISNVVGVGFRGNTNDVGSLFRDGALSVTNAIGVPTIAFANRAANAAPPLTKLRYTLERKNDGFYFSVASATGTVITAETKITDNADLVERVDSAKMYWGFFADREVRLLVENITLTNNGAASVAKTVPPANEGTYPVPAVELRSRSSTASPDYTLSLRPNYAGTLAVTRGSASLYKGKVAKAVEVFIPLVLESGENRFTAVFTPAEKNAPSKDAVTSEVTITLAGTFQAVVTATPATAAEIIDAAQNGQTIYLDSGSYGDLKFTVDNSGTRDKYVTIESAPGVGPVRVNTLSLGGTFVKAANLIVGGADSAHQVTGAPVSVGGDYNRLTNIVGQYGTNSGFNMGGNASRYDPNFWPKYNIYTNCTAFGNKDAAMADADGFAAKDVGPGNEYHGCVAYDNADDGWDFFNRVGNGPSKPVLIENCVAFNHPANGFKLGGETQPVAHVLRNSLSFDNGMAGVSDNFNPGGIVVENVVSIDNGTQNYILRDNTLIRPSNEVKNSLSFRSAAKKDVGLSDAISGKVTNSYITDAAGVSRNKGKTLSDTDFVSLDRADAYTRNDDGTLVRGTFGKLK